MKRSALILVFVVSFGMFLDFAPPSRAEKFACPATKLVPITFEPGVLRNSAANLVGREKLFTIFPGNWQTVQRRGRGYRIPKIIWGTNAIDLHEEVGQSSLTISGRRLDAESGPLVDWDANTAWMDRANPVLGGNATPVAAVDKRDFAITSSFIVPSPSCWEVTGHFRGEDLKIVIDVK